MGAFCGRCFQETLNDRGVCLVCSYDGAANREAFPMALPPGSILYGRYIVGRVLGQGGFGITYTARDYQTGQTVAIKEFFPDTMATRSGITVRPFAGERGENFPYGRDVFLEEARVLAEFQGHPNIVQVHVYFEENNTAYFVMEYVSGADLRRYIASHGGRLSWQEASRILLPVMDALSAVHSKGIIHRDIAPDNIYISDTGQVKLLDFGASRYSLGNVSHSLDVILKPGYTPKEQYRRRSRQGPYTDVYSLGATFYYAITGVRPDEALDRDEEDTLPYPSSLGARVTAEQEEVLLKAMAVEPQQRYQTMKEFFNAVMQPPPIAIPEPEPTPDPEPDPQPDPGPEPEPGPDPGTKRKLPKWLLPVGAAAVLAIGILIGTAGGKTPPAATESLPAAMEVLPEATDVPQIAQSMPEETVPQETKPDKRPILSGEIIRLEPTEDPEPTETIGSNQSQQVYTMAAFPESDEENNFAMATAGEIYFWGQTEYKRKLVQEIQFRNKLDNIPDTAWDVSKAGDSSIMAWLDNDGILTVAADGVIAANPNASYLFAYFPYLRHIDFGGCFDTSAVKDMSYLFYYCDDLQKLDLSGFDTSSVQNMHAICCGCKSLQSLNLSSFDTSNVTNMASMFAWCGKLTALDLSGFQTEKARAMNAMFSNCSGLTKLDLGGFVTDNVTTMGSMFNNCSSLQTLDISGFKVSDDTSLAFMFSGTHAITEFYCVDKKIMSEFEDDRK